MKVIFITGASGYIGGDILSQLIAKHPKHSYRLLVRNEQSQERILAAYPSVTIIPGSLEDLDVIARESAQADIIIRKNLPTLSARVVFALVYSATREVYHRNQTG
ncbi:nucleoside-diphosphate-sugar epimerase [Penicillium capsulatum]|uniref:Nucleoside-diphosphate-sugar epimerase n=1 Tax=Penicillium capsulatum TaxID=69766 RepID=A0A9W9IBA7_9EURO|nr:nucleoside-diphosphate-sugar epimerase [Penicillium capsulatum]KAJ6136591.1 nucleoside-diphosphate-sugar epimerase [Penicillium capsulatum]